VIALYAITDHPSPPLPEIAPLRVITSRGLAVVCGPATESEITPDELWRHEAVVEALMEDRDLVPVRYGTRVRDATDAARALEEHHPRLVRALDRVRGAAEVSVRAIAPDEADGVSSTGSEYLHAKARAASVGAALHGRLSEAARLNMRRPSSGTEVLRAAYLVDRGAVGTFAAIVRELDGANPALTLLCTGPWPPYSFAGE
jgi:Gas vesicle synthesis protein GvpL/GvpF